VAALDAHAWGTHDKILEQGVPAVEIEIRAAGEMGGLLEEDGLRAGYLTGVYCYFELLCGKDGVHDGDVRGREVR
jgi:hypothetical protein